MNTEKRKVNASADSSSRDLFELELRVARRADELAKEVAPLLDRNFEYWLRAEREVMGEWFATSA